MNNEEKILNFLEKMYIDLQETKEQMQKGFEKVNSELQEVKNTVTRIENEHGQKLGALFDGYKQNSDKLDRIEVEVSRHEEIILRRIR